MTLNVQKAYFLKNDKNLNISEFVYGKFLPLITIKIDSGVIVAVITAFTRELHRVTVINYALITGRERLMNLISEILFIRIHSA